jgi:hypothetical protein
MSCADGQWTKLMDMGERANETAEDDLRQREVARTRENRERERGLHQREKREREGIRLRFGCPFEFRGWR